MKTIERNDNDNEKKTVSSSHLSCCRKKRLLSRLEVETINATRYCDTQSKLKEAIRKKRPGLLTPGVLLMDDNARTYSATVTQNHIETFGWERLDHPPYSLDLVPSDFHLFPALKKNLA
ncbi:histone-lysine N-methyltransferase SETMAR [Trichonephila clavipes]|nr:histone-lysine N-methyltransferase SETMAR [Trichonephila clavipes]